MDLLPRIVEVEAERYVAVRTGDSRVVDDGLSCILWGVEEGVFGMENVGFNTNISWKC